MKITDWCTGCRSCEFQCPQGCIQLKPDCEGFLTTFVEEELCIDCGICTKICPQNNVPEVSLPQQVWAVRMKNDQCLRESASGGAFATIAQTVLKKGGVVYGAAYDKSLSVGHIRVDSLSELKKMQGSKYVQSDTRFTFSEVRELLEQKKIVFYSGTPCQIAGLKAYLGKKQEGLLTADLICHGVPSPKLFAVYLSWLENQSKERISYYNFRNKLKGWGLGFYSMYGTATKCRHMAVSFDPYYLYFLKGFTYRECCYRCGYAAQKRVADFTIGDYWGIEKEHPAFFSTKGVSLVLLNTSQSMEWMKLYGELFFLQASTFEQAASNNKNLIAPSLRPKERDIIYEQIDELSPTDYFKQKFPLNPSLKNKIAKMLPVGVKYLLKKIEILILTLK